MEGNIKVLSDDGCVGCGGSVPLQPSINPVDAIIVRNKPNITVGNVINKFTEGGKIVYELDDLELVKPIIAFAHDAGIREVGETVALVTFNGSITQGTFPIITRTITPDPGGLDLSAPFSFQKTNVTRITAGVQESHSVQAIDNNGNTTTNVAGVEFKTGFYQGFSELALLNEAQIKALANKDLLDNIQQEYGGLKTYVVPAAAPKYIYFVGRVGTAIPAGMVMNGLPVPLTVLAPVSVTNNSVITSCWVVRTSNKFNAGTYQIEMS